MSTITPWARRHYTARYPSDYVATEEERDGTSAPGAQALPPRPPHRRRAMLAGATMLFLGAIGLALVASGCTSSGGGPPSRTAGDVICAGVRLACGAAEMACGSRGTAGDESDEAAGE